MIMQLTREIIIEICNAFAAITALSDGMHSISGWNGSQQLLQNIGQT